MILQLNNVNHETLNVLTNDLISHLVLTEHLENSFILKLCSELQIVGQMLFQSQT